MRAAPLSLLCGQDPMEFVPTFSSGLLRVRPFLPCLPPFPTPRGERFPIPSGVSSQWVGVCFLGFVCSAYSATPSVALGLFGFFSCGPVFFPFFYSTLVFCSLNPFPFFWPPLRVTPDCSPPPIISTECTPLQSLLVLQLQFFP